MHRHHHHHIMAENLSNEEKDLAFLLFFSGTTSFSIASAVLGVAGELGCRGGVGCGGVSLGVGEPHLIDPPLHFLRTHARQPKPLLFSSCVHSAEKAKLLHARYSILCNVSHMEARHPLEARRPGNSFFVPHPHEFRPRTPPHNATNKTVIEHPQPKPRTRI